MTQTLLLADDSDVIRGLIERGLAEVQLDLIASSNGNEAIEMARSLVPDIVLADVGLPGQNGYQVCRAIKESPELGHIPVVLLAGAFEPFDPEKAQASGADDLITKPIEAGTLVERLKALLAPTDPLPSLAPPGEATRATTPVGGNSRPVPLPDDFILADELDLADESDLLEAVPLPALPLPKEDLFHGEPLDGQLEADPFADEGFDFGAPAGSSAPGSPETKTLSSSPPGLDPHRSGGIPTEASPEETPEPGFRQATAPQSEQKQPEHATSMRPAIHDALEEIAGDAFSELPEAVIQALIERIEAIAWEVIPQMAEVLIREEIRRMKEGPE